MGTSFDRQLMVADGPPVNRHKPSVDVLFRSAARCAGGDVLAILLTGMGDGGARGMKLLRDGGARTVVRHEASCVVFGMPMQPIELGAAGQVLPPDCAASAMERFDARARRPRRAPGGCDLSRARAACR